jgi:hypothetical protein
MTPEQSKRLSGARFHVHHSAPFIVTPAKAGVHASRTAGRARLCECRLRGHDRGERDALVLHRPKAEPRLCAFPAPIMAGDVIRAGSGPIGGIGVSFV